MSNYLKPLKLAVIAALAANTQVVLAEVAPYTLGEINVTTFKEEAARLANDTITQDDLRLFNRETVGSALNMLPGVSLTGVQQAGNGAQRNEQMVQIRGFNLRQIPIYIDGIPLYVSYDGYVDLGRFTTYDLSKIQVSKGFSSVLYGANTLGGAINLISRKPVKEFEGSVTAGLKTDRDFKYNGYTTDASFGGNQGTWYWQANASLIDINRYRMSSDFTPNRFEDGGVRDNSYSRDGKINLKFGITPREGDEYSINYINQQASKGSPPYAGSSTQNVNRWQWPQWDKESLYFISDTKLGQDSYIKLRAFYDKFENRLENFGTDATYTNLAAGFPSYYSDHTYGSSAEFGTKLSENNTLKVSAHIKYDVHRSNDFGKPKDRYEDRTTSIGIEDTHAFTDKLSLVTGVSYDQRTNIDASTFTATGVPFEFNKGSAQAWNPQAGLFYRPTEDSEIHVTVARKSRFATLKDRFSTSFGTTLQNPNLKNEFSTNYEIGASGFVVPQLRLQGAVFYYDTKDMIQQISGLTGCTTPGSLGCLQQANVGKVISTGIEVGATYYANEDLELGFSYSYIGRDNKNSNYTLLGVPHNKLFAYGRWQATSQLAISGNIDASDGTTLSRLNTGNNGVWQPSQGYALLNLKGTYLINQDWTADLGMNNLLDKNYAYMEGFFLEGRNLFLNVTRKF
ncbi:TonB-dependent receptor [Methylobacillus flagellatus]|uniref:TonB-dependent receptor plug domain-containing protein n=1 Tax=Methylobacillus flagellatus TaxID=405 RepID=UPI002853CCDD|nr:TonB-dependent receptor [Methylobacillus flagellatus]MDR5172608.1 TonB-dependent receptor [Methylobacillus flagellatus]